MKVLHIITGLHVGGAEMMLFKLLAHMNRDEFENEVISLISPGPIAQRLEEIGIVVRTLNMKRGVPDLSASFKLARYIKTFSPDIVQTWMYHADLLGGVVTRLISKAPVIWNCRRSDVEISRTKKTTWMVMKLCAWLSYSVPKAIICNSSAAKESHKRLGYNTKRFEIIPNGFDTTVFRPDQEARAQIRRELNVGPTEMLIGMVARYDPIKDPENFLNAATELRKSCKQCTFLLCGEGFDSSNAELIKIIERLDLASHVRLLGERKDAEKIMAALNIFTLSSKSEGFPNVVGEAMACGIPCVVTDVGDCRTLIGSSGIIVPIGSPVALAQGWEKIIVMSRPEQEALGAAARVRIESFFSIQAITSRYEEFYRRQKREAA